MQKAKNQLKLLRTFLDEKSFYLTHNYSILGESVAERARTNAFEDVFVSFSLFCCSRLFSEERKKDTRANIFKCVCTVPALVHSSPIVD